MSSYTSIIYQLVWSTKHRQPVIEAQNKKILYAYIHSILTNKKCHTYWINGVDDHLHIAFSLHPSVAVADLVKDIKVATNLMIKRENLFPKFTGWQTGYGAFTYSQESKARLIHYIQNQEVHHNKFTYEDEIRILLEEHGIEFDEKYLF